ncbi:hypothetical protein [Micromonospora sp. WMMD812]|uniref:hypothetical protein n=1 Tax=Micromonospora sp. WMMD812 TaxID=3015152 RepID=UPI00248BB431|nr:hypothetical protein [Micromonospora sp. WMMD812]WBB66911.1 hypothetical protein O7603_27920 [Micromonospora sp. WMMD812]
MGKRWRGSRRRPAGRMEVRSSVRLTQQPGEYARYSGIWQALRGEYQATVVRGRRMPPTRLGGAWVLLRRTRTKQ